MPRGFSTRSPATRSSVAAAACCRESEVSAPLATRAARASKTGLGEASSANHRDALSTGQSADEAVARKDQRRNDVAVLVEQLHLAAGELPGGDDAETRKAAARGRGAVAAGAALGRI